MARLGCPEANPVDGGDSCYAVVERAQLSGKFDLKTGCVAAAKDVAAVRQCGTIRCRKAPRFMGDDGG